MGEVKDVRAEERKILFDKYEMGRVLGKGTFAKVYYGRNLHTGESVAIKVINKDQVLRETGMMEQIQREISVMCLVRHANVVELREVMATRSRIFFVMEYVPGGELFVRVDQGRLPEDQARRYFHQLISAVDFFHSRGVSHRDLKPENLLLDAKGDLKISDFGLSALPDQLRHDGLLHTQCGTPAYVAPEVIRRRGYNGSKADLWSCGVILYVLLAGFLPFQDVNIMRMYRKVLKAEYEVPPWFSADARRLVNRLLVPDQEKRITIAEIMNLSWFKKGSRRRAPMQLISPPLPAHPPEAVSREVEGKTGTQRFYNAFELISTMSSGFDLSNIFESRRKAGTVFTSRSPASVIMDRLERVGHELGFRVHQLNGRKVKLEGRENRCKGRLTVAAEVFKVADGFTVVEFSKLSGDTLEYTKFCAEDVRPGLKDIVWTWQGDEQAGAAHCGAK